MGEGLALSLYIIYNICGLHSKSGCSPHCLSLHGSNVFPKECSNAKGAMMSFAPKRLLVFPKERSNAKGAMMSFVPKRLLVFPEERSNGKRAMMSFAPKRPDVFPWERLLYQLDGDATCVVAGPVGFGSRFLVAWEAAFGGWKRCCGGLAKRVSGYLENGFGGGGMGLSGPGRGARLRSD